MNSPIALVLALLVAASGTASAQNDRSAAEVIYGHKLGMALTMDVFKPDGDANGAGILHMVSGRWISSWPVLPQGAHMRRIRALLDRGFTVFAVYHGSSPRFTVPEAVEDVQKALQFVHANAADFGVDPQRLGVHGGSAGGHLSLMLGLAPAGNSEDSPSGLIAAVVSFYAPVDLREMAGSRSGAIRWEPSQAPSISPIDFVSSDDPPTLLVHGTDDPDIPFRNSERMLEALKEQNVPTELLVLEGAGHGFRGEDRQRAIEALVAWFEKHLSP